MLRTDVLARNALEFGRWKCVAGSLDFGEGPIGIQIPKSKIQNENHPPAIAPTIQNSSLPDATASGKGVSGESWDKSSSQAKKRSIGRRFLVPWSRIVPQRTG